MIYKNIVSIYNYSFNFLISVRLIVSRVSFLGFIESTFYKIISSSSSSTPDVIKNTDNLKCKVKEEDDHCSLFKMVNKYINNEKKRFLLTYNDETIANPSSTQLRLKINKNIDEIFYNLKNYKKMVNQDNNILENQWKRRILYESTPIGNIVMFYDVYKKGFSYYSDYHISYPLLNSVAMKYVRIYCCRDLFIDDKITPADNPSPFIKLEEDEEKEEKKEEKEKNKKENSIIRNGPFIKIKKNVEVNTSTNTNEKNKQDQNLNNVNRFINMGKISNFSFIQKMDKKRVIQPIKNGFVGEALSKMTKESKEFDNMFNEEHELQKEVLSYCEYRNFRTKVKSIGKAESQT